MKNARRRRAVGAALARALASLARVRPARTGSRQPSSSSRLAARHRAVRSLFALCARITDRAAVSCPTAATARRKKRHASLGLPTQVPMTSPDRRSEPGLARAAGRRPIAGLIAERGWYSDASSARGESTQASWTRRKSGRGAGDPDELSAGSIWPASGSSNRPPPARAGALLSSATIRIAGLSEAGARRRRCWPRSGSSRRGMLGSASTCRPEGCLTRASGRLRAARPSGDSGLEEKKSGGNDFACAPLVTLKRGRHARRRHLSAKRLQPSDSAPQSPLGRGKIIFRIFLGSTEFPSGPTGRFLGLGGMAVNVGEAANGSRGARAVGQRKAAARASRERSGRFATARRRIS
jgi:hypothetical protein